jgi:hypothetical protein
MTYLYLDLPIVLIFLLTTSFPLANFRHIGCLLGHFPEIPVPLQFLLALLLLLLAHLLPEGSG